MIPLWRNKPVSSPKGDGTKFLDKHIFPSGRQALTHCLKHAGLTRKDRVAVPEWSSHCVISAVGKIATPIPMQEVVSHDLDVEAVLIYDQWGWPVFDNSYQNLEKRFSGKILIHDQVDSTRIPWSSDESKYTEIYEGFKSIYQVFSLSKTLGLAGGGMVRWNGKWLEASIKNDHELLVELLDELPKSNELNESPLPNFMKFDIAAFPSSLMYWIKDNDVIKAYEKEYENRKKNIRVIVNSDLSKRLPFWLIRAVNDGNIPGIVPLFLKFTEDRLALLQKDLKSNFKIETEIYHFDFNGNPMQTDYKKCLALPVHGMINNMDTIVTTLLGMQK